MAPKRTKDLLLSQASPQPQAALDSANFDSDAVQKTLSPDLQALVSVILTSLHRRLIRAWTE